MGKRRKSKKKKRRVGKVKRPRAEIARSDADVAENSATSASGKSSETAGQFREREAEACPYCESKDFVKRGLRDNKHQAVQLYVCRSCNRTFTSRTIKGKQFPWPVVLDAVSYHNLGYTFEQISRIKACTARNSTWDWLTTSSAATPSRASKCFDWKNHGKNSAPNTATKTREKAWEISSIERITPQTPENRQIRAISSGLSRDMDI
ncbi:MAG: hypothetical protein AAB734_04820 [Patescibacteria group bacterium]